MSNIFSIKFWSTSLLAIVMMMAGIFILTTATAHAQNAWTPPPGAFTDPTSNTEPPIHTGSTTQVKGTLLNGSWIPTWLQTALAPTLETSSIIGAGGFLSKGNSFLSTVGATEFCLRGNSQNYEFLDAVHLAITQQQPNSFDCITDWPTGTLPPGDNVDDILIWNGTEWVPGPNSSDSLWSEDSTANTMWNTETGRNVGIGNTDAGEKLDVSGDVKVRGPNFWGNTDPSAKIFLGDTNHVIKSVRAFGLSFGTFQAPDGLVLRESTGNVGIGNTDPSAKLDVSLNGLNNGTGTPLLKVGGPATEVSGSGAVAIGYLAKALQDRSVAIGSYSEATGQFAFSAGTNAKATGLGATAYGSETVASGVRSSAMGYGTLASGDFAAALGQSSIAAGKDSLALGSMIHVNGKNSVGIGLGPQIGTPHYYTVNDDETLYITGGDVKIGSNGAGNASLVNINDTLHVGGDFLADLISTTANFRNDIIFSATRPDSSINNQYRDISKNRGLTILAGGGMWQHGNSTFLGDQSVWGNQYVRENLNVAKTSKLTGKVNIDHELQFTGGNPGLGKVLTSDNIGNATWQEIPEVITPINSPTFTEGDEAISSSCSGICTRSIAATCSGGGLVIGGSAWCDGGGALQSSRRAGGTWYAECRSANGTTAHAVAMCMTQ